MAAINIGQGEININITSAKGETSRALIPSRGDIFEIEPDHEILICSTLGSTVECRGIGFSTFSIQHKPIPETCPNPPIVQLGPGQIRYSPVPIGYTLIIKFLEQ